MQYYFQTPFGVFFISTAPYGGYNLKLNDDVINWSQEAKDLALQVYEKASGCEEWDFQKEINAPKSLESWNIKL